MTWPRRRSRRRRTWRSRQSAKLERQKRVGDVLRIFLGNMTCWGPKAKKNIQKQLEGEVPMDVALLQEHHLPEGELRQAEEWCRGQHLRPFFGPSRPSERGQKGGLHSLPEATWMLGAFTSALPRSSSAPPKTRIGSLPPSGSEGSPLLWFLPTSCMG